MTASCHSAKEYKKLTSDEFRELIGLLPEIRKGDQALRDAVRAASRDRLDQLLVQDYNWGWVYEYSFQEHLALMIVAFNQADEVKAIASSENPQRAILDETSRLLRDERRPSDDKEPLTDPQTLIGLTHSLLRSIQSVLVFGQTISALVAKVRDEHDHTALFNAVRMDRAALATPSIADRIARAELRGDSVFFRHLQSALKGPQGKHWLALQDMRYAFMVLRELGINDLSDADLERLFIDVLGAYPNTPTARKNLRAQYQRSRKLANI